VNRKEKKQTETAVLELFSIEAIEIRLCQIPGPTGYEK